MSLEDFACRMEGGWLFGYVEALARADAGAEIFCVSRSVSAPKAFTHAPTRARVWVLPVPKLYRRLRQLVSDPYAWEPPRGHARRGIRDVMSYFSIPASALGELVRRAKVDSLLVQEYEDPRFDVVVRMGRRIGVPVFATFQGGMWQRSRLERWLRPRSMKHAAGLIIATGAEVERVQARYGLPRRKIGRIFNPLDHTAWTLPRRTEARRGLGMPEEAWIAVWHGRIDVHRKGIDILLDAWSRVTTARPERELRLLLVGAGAGADELRSRLDHGAAPGVLWRDEYVLDKAELRRYLAAANAYVLPSRHEGFPVALIEAMASGLPVVAADAPGVRDILGEENPVGLIVPRENPAALAGAIGQLLDDASLSEHLGRAAHLRIEGHFGLEPVGRALRAFLLGESAAASDVVEAAAH